MVFLTNWSKKHMHFLNFFYFITLAIDMKGYEICPSLTTLAHSYYSLSPWWADGLNPPPHTHTHTHTHTNTYLKTFSIQYRPNEIRDKHKNKPMREVVCLEDYKKYMFFLHSSIGLYLIRKNNNLRYQKHFKEKNIKWKTCWIRSITATKSIHYLWKSVLSPLFKNLNTYKQRRFKLCSS